MQSEVYFWGSGDGAFEMLHLLEDLNRAGAAYVVKGIVGRGPRPNNKDLIDLSYTDVDTPGWESTVPRHALAVVTAGDPLVREAMWEEIEKLGLTSPVLIHPSAVVSSTAHLAAGCVVGPNATISALVTLSENVYVSFNASVGHHSRVGLHGVVSPGARLGGEVTCGTHFFIGLGGVVVPRVKIGDRVTVSAGALVAGHLPNGSKVIQQKSRVLSGWNPAHEEGRAPAKTISILFLSKTNSWCQAAERFLRASGYEVTVIQGERHDPLPAAVREWSGDYIISYLCAWILPEEILRRARVAAINFHPGPPEYPGIGCYNFALYDEKTEYGVTCHHMLALVDSGSIIEVLRFPVLPFDSIALLKERSMAAQLALFYQVIGRLLAGQSLPSSKEGWRRKPFTRVELDALCRATPDMLPAEVRRRVRATYFPGYPGPYLEKDGQKYPLVPEGAVGSAS
jgi:methionyl-tRNA formyltransferase